MVFCLLCSTDAFAGKGLDGLDSAEMLRLDRREQAGDLSVLNVESPGQKKILETASRAIAPSAPGLDRLIAQMEKTARQQGGMGIAAVQLGIPVRVVLVRRREEDGPERFQAFINPKIIGQSVGRLASWENCLSVPWGYRFTYRPAQTTLRFQAADGGTQIETLKGEEAVVLQQEIDHLNGQLLSHRHPREWFIPPNEIDAFARRIWRECQAISKAQCDKRMKAGWAERAGNTVHQNPRSNPE